MELGALSAMIYGFRERELVIDLFERVTGLRMNHAYFRPGGVPVDVPEDFEAGVREIIDVLPKRTDELEDLLSQNPIWVERNAGVGILTAEQCFDLGVTGPVLRSAGRRARPARQRAVLRDRPVRVRLPTTDTCDAYGRFLIRVREMRESIKIVRQALDTLPGGPVMVADKKIAWPASRPSALTG